MKTKKILALLLALVMVAAMFAACGDTTTPETESEPPVSQEPNTNTEDPSTETIYIPLVSKGFQHKFWQTVQAGAQAAAADYGVEISFDGPPSESDISVQVDMLNSVLAQNPAALCLAALDTESVLEQLNSCIEKGIPVIGFDSGVPDAPAGAIYSTASTDNEAAGALAAETMMSIAEIADAVAAATPGSPVVISVISQDATSASITGRTTGFVDKMFELCGAVHAGGVAVTGHDTWKKDASGDVAVEILVSIAASTSVADCQTAAQAVFQRSPIGVFCTNSGSVDGVLSATADGSDLDRESGRYKDIVVIGFDSGATLLNAVEKQWFHGAVTQDPYMIGYYAVELAYKVIKGESVDEIVDTGCQYYTYENMNDPTIAALLYE